MNQLTLTVIGNLTDEPELRFTSNGTAVSRFTVAHNPRKQDGQGNWVDGEPTFITCQAWRQLAEHVAESLPKGARVIVYGRIRTERWEDEKTKEKRSRQVLDVDGCGPDLTYATASVKKMSRGSREESGLADDPWSSASKGKPAEVG